MFSDVWTENFALSERLMEIHWGSTDTILWLSGLTYINLCITVLESHIIDSYEDPAAALGQDHYYCIAVSPNLHPPPPPPKKKKKNQHRWLKVANSDATDSSKYVAQKNNTTVMILLWGGGGGLRSTHWLLSVLLHVRANCSSKFTINGPLRNLNWPIDLLNLLFYALSLYFLIREIC